MPNIGNSLLTNGKGIKEVYLPPSNLHNINGWQANYSFYLPQACDENQCICLVRNDILYVIDNGLIYMADLKTKTWIEETIETGIGYPGVACWYDDHFIFLVEKRPSYAANVAQIVAVDVIEKTWHYLNHFSSQYQNESDLSTPVEGSY